MKKKALETKEERLERLNNSYTDLILRVYQDPLEFSDLLKAQLNLSKSTKYSAHNRMLILAQKPEATFVQSFKAWKKLGFPVNKGEKGIYIKSPIISKGIRKPNGDLVFWKDADALDKANASKGAPGYSIEEKYIGISTCCVFDISSTEATIDDVKGLMKDRYHRPEDPDELYELLSDFFQDQSDEPNASLKSSDLVSRYVKNTLDEIKEESPYQFELLSNAIEHLVLNTLDLDDRNNFMESLHNHEWTVDEIKEMKDLSEFIVKKSEMILDDICQIL
ncbi:ArdC family protein [Ileibacterium valens]|uniref:ArdC family protein n=1 Tax=Ileibacterium valens TaxID=1862668 RepID=UPI002570B73E|nr:ArdC family protein [Ileibacterium valens]